MTFHLIHHTRPCLVGALGCLLVLAGCAGQEPKGLRPDPASIKKVLFRMDPDNLDGLPASQLHGMADRVGKNLGTWGYVITADEKAGDYTHVMEAKIDEVAHKGTPAGFSFTLGNSDPRALDFQKANVLPVDCVLYPVGRPKDKASLYMDFIADEKLQTASRSKPEPAVVDTYVNHAATVCFNLLEDLKVQRVKPTPKVAGALGGTDSSSGDSWFPEVRIEVREKPANPAAAQSISPAPAAPVTTSAPTPRPAPAAAPAPTSNAAPSAPAESPAAAPQAEPAAPAAPAVTTETKFDKEEGRKQMIIHNQGTPIILEFGYERK